MNLALSPVLPSPTGSLQSYLAKLKTVPVLTYEQEQHYAHQWHNEQNFEAAKYLVLANLRFVVRIAYGYKGYGLAVADLIQEGTIGLMKAVKRFDPNQGVRLISFAVHWIKAEMHDFIIRNWRIVKVATTKAQRKLFFNLRKNKNGTGFANANEVNAIAKELDVSPETLREMDMRLNAHDTSFDSLSNENDPAFSAHNYLKDNRYDPARLIEQEDHQDQNSSQLHHAMMKLDNRSQQILKARWLADKKATLQDLADEHNISAERVRQLEKSALVKLKQALAAL